MKAMNGKRITAILAAVMLLLACPGSGTAEETTGVALAGDETAGTYGRYAEEDDMLFLIPALFADQTMEELYKQYESILAEAEVEMSRVRDTEDPL